MRRCKNLELGFIRDTRLFVGGDPWAQGIDINVTLS